jgi:hypothetical protein
LLAIGAVCRSADGANLLTNGTFEPTGGEAPGWTLQEFVTGNSAVLDTAQVLVATTTQTGAPGERHMWLRAFAGGQTAGPNNLTNAVLTQTVPVTAGSEYKFSGWSRFEVNYSGGYTTLDGSSPLGAVTSPTTTQFQMEFLDGSNSLLGSPVVLDVKADRIAQIGFPDPNDNGWYQHMLSAVAPVGTAFARVTASGRDMVWQVGPTQSAFFDSFSLTATGAPSTELLVNPGLETPPATGLENWTVSMNDPGAPDNMQVVRAASFANHTTGGTRGVWLSAFFGEPGTEVDGAVSQTVAGAAGGQYTFTGWSKWETNFTTASTTMELAFLDGTDVVIGVPVSLNVGNDRTVQSGGNPKDGAWYQHTLSGSAPPGTARVRVTAGMTDGVNGGANPQSGFFDDFVLEVAPAATPGDLDGDGHVDGNDVLVWQRGLGTTYTSAHLNAIKMNFGAVASAAVASIPEPGSCSLLVAGLVLTLKSRSIRQGRFAKDEK